MTNTAVAAFPPLLKPLLTTEQNTGRNDDGLKSEIAKTFKF